MITFDKLHAQCKQQGQPCSYFGERGHWLVFLHQHRDSDKVQRSNFDVAIQRLVRVNKNGFTIERENHWAVGWIDTLLIDPQYSELVLEAEKMQDEIKDYPLLDEEHYNELEYQEAADFWSSASIKERKEILEKAKIDDKFAAEDNLHEVPDDSGKLYEYLTIK